MPEYLLRRSLVGRWIVWRRRSLVPHLCFGPPGVYRGGRSRAVVRRVWSSPSPRPLCRPLFRHPERRQQRRRFSEVQISASESSRIASQHRVDVQFSQYGAADTGTRRRHHPWASPQHQIGRQHWPDADPLWVLHRWRHWRRWASLIAVSAVLARQCFARVDIFQMKFLFCWILVHGCRIFHCLNFSFAVNSFIFHSWRPNFRRAF